MPVKRPVSPPDHTPSQSETTCEVVRKNCSHQGGIVLQWSISRMLLITFGIAIALLVVCRDSPFMQGVFYVWSHLGEMFGLCQILRVTNHGFGFALGEVVGFFAFVFVVIGCFGLFCLAWVWTEKEE